MHDGIIIAVVVFLLLFLILGGLKKFTGSENFASAANYSMRPIVPMATACAMCTRLPNGQSCQACKQHAGVTEHLRDVGACATMCDKWPGSQSCAACLNNQPQGSDQNLRGAVLGLLE
jgi:hypothetical protein